MQDLQILAYCKKRTLVKGRFQGEHCASFNYFKGGALLCGNH